MHSAGRLQGCLCPSLCLLGRDAQQQAERSALVACRKGARLAGRAAGRTELRFSKYKHRKHERHAMRRNGRWSAHPHPLCGNSLLQRAELEGCLAVNLPAAPHNTGSFLDKQIVNSNNSTRRARSRHV